MSQEEGNGVSRKPIEAIKNEILMKPIEANENMKPTEANEKVKPIEAKKRIAASLTRSTGTSCRPRQCPPSYLKKEIKVDDGSSCWLLPVKLIE